MIYSSLLNRDDKMMVFFVVVALDLFFPDINLKEERPRKFDFSYLHRID